MKRLLISLVIQNTRIRGDLVRRHSPSADTSAIMAALESGVPLHLGGNGRGATRWRNVGAA